MINAFGVSPCIAAKHEATIAQAMHAKLGARGRLPKNQKTGGGKAGQLAEFKSLRNNIKAIIAENPGLKADEIHKIFKEQMPDITNSRVRYYLYEMRSANWLYSQEAGRPKRQVWYVTEETK